MFQRFREYIYEHISKRSYGKIYAHCLQYPENNTPMFCGCFHVPDYIIY